MPWDERIGRRLRLKDLYTLQIIAEAGSMAKASRRLSLSQPAISKAIADMEHSIGTSLLDRSSRGVELTASGQLLIARSRIVFDELREGIKEIQHPSDPPRGELRIGTTEPITGQPGKVVELAAQSFGLTDTERGSVLQHLLSDDDLSRYGLLNAITRTGEAAKSYDRAVELQTLGSEVLRLPSSAWQRLAAAA